jgi:hypothetical protein
MMAKKKELLITEPKIDLENVAKEKPGDFKTPKEILQEQKEQTEIFKSLLRELTGIVAVFSTKADKVEKAMNLIQKNVFNTCSDLKDFCKEIKETQCIKNAMKPNTPSQLIRER